MNHDGSNKTRLTNQPGQDTYPSMSPDGKFIVFESYRDGHAEIYRMDEDGSNVIRLTTFDGDTTSSGDAPPPGNGNPSWSPFLRQ
jgi:TolB protein